ncbi:unnamed protein product [Prorocentrum cordatum]|uniref:Uncharacterized protein n=1 Tax=Prorocentrum cordatum TaxID=2364126 RepID=A0ABN9UTT4_9DINO|nr:unnamed protein product [Polarella glacialis]
MSDWKSSTQDPIILCDEIEGYHQDASGRICPSGTAEETMETIRSGDKTDQLEAPIRARAAAAGRRRRGLFWNERGLWKPKREMPSGKAVEAGLSGSGAFVLKSAEKEKLCSQTTGHLRAWTQGLAKTTHADSRATATSDLDVLEHRKTPPARAEQAVRMTKETIEAAMQQMPAHARKLMTLALKQLLRCAQQSRDMGSVIFAACALLSSGPIAPRAPDQAAARGKIHAMGSLLAAAKDLQPEEPLKSNMSNVRADCDCDDNGQKCELVLFCRADRMHEPNEFGSEDLKDTEGSFVAEANASPEDSGVEKRSQQHYMATYINDESLFDIKGVARVRADVLQSTSLMADLGASQQQHHSQTHMLMDHTQQAGSEREANKQRMLQNEESLLRFKDAWGDMQQQLTTQPGKRQVQAMEKSWNENSTAVSHRCGKSAEASRILDTHQEHLRQCLKEAAALAGALRDLGVQKAQLQQEASASNPWPSDCPHSESSTDLYIASKKLEGELEAFIERPRSQLESLLVPEAPTAKLGGARCTTSIVFLDEGASLQALPTWSMIPSRVRAAGLAGARGARPRTPSAFLDGAAPEDAGAALGGTERRRGPSPDAAARGFAAVKQRILRRGQLGDHSPRGHIDPRVAEIVEEVPMHPASTSRKESRRGLLGVCSWVRSPAFLQGCAREPDNSVFGSPVQLWRCRRVAHGGRLIPNRPCRWRKRVGRLPSALRPDPPRPGPPGIRKACRWKCSAAVAPGRAPPGDRQETMRQEPR